jgi:hypothetical protein
MAVEIISTVTVQATATAPAGPYDLTDLATVHDELNIPITDTVNDPFLQRAISQASAVISNYCNRVFAVESIQDLIYVQQDEYPFQTPGGVYPLQLSRWPMVNQGVVNFHGNTHASTVVDGIASTAGMKPGMLVFASDGSIPPGTQIDNVYPKSITLTEDTATSVAGLSMNTGVQVIQTRSVGDTQTLVYGSHYTIDAKFGWLIRLNSFLGTSQKWEAEPVTVQYQAGYTDVPVDLVDACLRLVTARFKARGRDPMLVEQTQPQTIGSQRFWVGTQAGQTGSLPPEIESIVSQFRVPVSG